MSKKNKSDKLMKNLEFLYGELQKEWDESKETKHTVIMTLEEGKRYRKEMQEYIAFYGEMLERNEDISFKESVGYCKQNYITLRFGRKLISEYEKAKDSGEVSIKLMLDREEYKLYKEIREAMS